MTKSWVGVLLSLPEMVVVRVAGFLPGREYVGEVLEVVGTGVGVVWCRWR